MHRFFPRIIDYTVDDGYWIEKFPFRATSDELNPNVIAYGLGTTDQKSDIVMLQNPYNSENEFVSSCCMLPGLTQYPDHHQRVGAGRK